MDLIDADQVLQIRTTMFDIGDTFAFPISIIRTTYTNGAFGDVPTTETIPLTAVRDFKSNNEKDGFRNQLGPAEAHLYDLYVGWDKVEAAGLLDVNDKVLLDHNDLVEMEGKIYEIVAFAGVGDMTKRPVFLCLQVKYRWENPNGGDSV